MIEAVDATLRYLPPYSLDFDPIEHAFARLKSILRKRAARTIAKLWNAIRHALPTFSPYECENYFAGARYEPE